MSERSFLGRLEALATVLEPRRRSLYRYVAEQLTPVSRDQAAAAVGVSRAMAAFHLDKLVEAGLLRTQYRRLSGRTGRGAGRPSKLYRRSRRRFDVTLPGREHELLARLLVESARETDDISGLEEMGRAYGRSLGARARTRVRSRPTAERLARCVEDVTAELGFEPIATGAGEVRARNCPFDPLSRRFPAVVCGAALAIVGGVLDGIGADDLRVTRSERRDWCCVVVKPSSLL